jgi:hypothetical protein
LLLAEVEPGRYQQVTMRLPQQLVQVQVQMATQVRMATVEVTVA